MVSGCPGQLQVSMNELALRVGKFTTNIALRLASGKKT
jgi:hypothetical protein